MDWEHILDIAESLLQKQEESGGWQADACSHCCSVHTLHEDRLEGHWVCTLCATVQHHIVFGVDWDATDMQISNYKRIHHWHERISQLLLTESTIPPESMHAIHTAIRESNATCLNKGVIRAVLRSLNMQVYIEKWLQIMWSFTGQQPPRLPTAILIELDRRFLMLQHPFNTLKPDKRKNFLNYNYTFCRLFQLMGCPEYGMFFPLIKSKNKLGSLDQIWETICAELKWKYDDLIVVPEFSMSI